MNETHDPHGALLRPVSLSELAGLSVRLGLTAFGGPAAHIAMLRDEVVTRRGWMSAQYFLDLLGVTNLLPGPNSTEMFLATGYSVQGRRGLFVSGFLFILPAFTLTLIFAWLYVHYGATPAGTWFLYGVKPVIIAIVLQALWNLARTAIKSVFLGIVTAVVLALYLLGAPTLALLVGAAALVMLVANVRRRRRPPSSPPVNGGQGTLPPADAADPPPPVNGGQGGLAAIFLPWLPTLQRLAFQAQAAVPYTPWLLFWQFLVIGATIYGSGYVLLAYLNSSLVDTYGWLTQQQLLDAIAVGQFTPGPVFTTATFVGFLVGGFPGAVLATAGIFLPAFVYVAIVNPFVPRLRGSPWVRGILDGANVAAVGLMAGVEITLARAALIDAITVAIGVIAFILLIRFRVNSVWLIAGGALVGVAVGLLRGWSG
ncbi:MAG: chromate efflux transporter [Anaerolineae bacterium]